MRVWIFSDLHLDQAESELYQSFLKVLQEPESETDIVVFAGDIFDLLVGESTLFLQKHESFFEAVRKLSQRGVKLFYIEGNHDFHIKKLFQDSRIQFEDEAVLLQLPKKIYIAHGDLVDQADQRYLFLRKFFRSWPVKKIIQSAPGKWVEAIGTLASRPLESKVLAVKEAPETGEPFQRIRAAFRSFADEKIRQGFDYVVLGHCHDLDQVEPSYWNMGYPPLHRQYLFYDSAKDALTRREFI